MRKCKRNCAFNATLSFQEEAKPEEGEEKEQEFLGKLEYTLDYNFTDNQVSVHVKKTILK